MLYLCLIDQSGTSLSSGIKVDDSGLTHTQK